MVRKGGAGDDRNTRLAVHSCVAPSLAVAFALAGILGCAACPRGADTTSSSAGAAQRECEAALLQYASLVREQDATGIARLFIPEGRVEHVGQDPIVGRERIAEFLNSLAGYQVISHDMRIAKSTGTSTRVTQSGTYHQVVRTPEGSEVEARGWFQFQWSRQPGGEWLLESAKTSSGPFGEI